MIIKSPHDPTQNRNIIYREMYEPVPSETSDQIGTMHRNG